MQPKASEISSEKRDDHQRAGQPGCDRRAEGDADEQEGHGLDQAEGHDARELPHHERHPPQRGE